MPFQNSPYTAWPLRSLLPRPRPHTENATPYVRSPGLSSQGPHRVQRQAAFPSGVRAPHCTLPRDGPWISERPGPCIGVRLGPWISVRPWPMSAGWEATPWPYPLPYPLHTEITPVSSKLGSFFHVPPLTEYLPRALFLPVSLSSLASLVAHPAIPTT